MTGIAQALAFMSLVVASTYLEVKGYGAGGLWVVVVLWVLFGDWSPRVDKHD